MSLSKLQALAESWGGAVLVVSSDDPVWDLPSVTEAPFSSWLGIDHPNMKVYLTEKAHLGEVIHEMGHVFASLRTPYFSEEYDFFGWEFVVAQKADLVTEWLEGAGNYSVGGTQYVEFEDMTPDEQSDLLEERVQHAQKLGLIVGDEPVTVRTGRQ